MTFSNSGDLACPPAKVRPSAQRILVVEDDNLVRELVVEILESFGYEVFAANSGVSALHLLDSDTAFDVMLSDVQMPNGMSGFQLARQARGRMPNLAIILSSGMSGLSDDIEARAVNASMLRKPYRIDELSRAVEAAIDSILKLI